MRYGYQHYNRHDVLKPHWGFWLTTLFLSRHVIGFVLLTMSGRGGRVGVNPDAIDLGGIMSLIEPIYMIADIPALLLLYALGARVPKSGKIVRRIWRRGRWLILASAAVYVALFAATNGFEIARLDAASWASLSITSILTVYAVRSRYLADLFSQFPAAESDPGA